MQSEKSKLLHLFDCKVEHKLTVDGTKLIETTKSLIITDADDPTQIVYQINKHERCIGNRSMETKEVIIDGVVDETPETPNMSEEEQDAFKKEWARLWRPRITSEEVMEKLEEEEKANHKTQN